MTAVEVRTIPRWLEVLTDALAGAVIGGLILPGIGISGAPIHATPTAAVIAVALTIAAALTMRRVAARSILALAAAELAVFAGCFLLNDASYPGSGFVVGLLIGAGLGPLLPRGRESWPIWAPAGIAGLIFFTWVRARFGAGEAALFLSVAAFGAVASTLAARRYVLRSPGRTRLLTGVVALYTGFAVFWVGSTAPTVQWFGALEFHGPRDSNEVAITFDDGPNPPYTLEIARILEEYDARGTFFEVGKAVEQRPDVTRELIERGHLVGNHSYEHGAFSYLKPDDPEIKRTQGLIQEATGQCPAFFRPPHGTHTPFMSKAVNDMGMTVVNWDVSAKDWIETDAERLTNRILDRVRPGSIILLHDGSDGDIGADRTVILEALPAILEGLQAKGLKPVTLDRLLGQQGYVADCD